MNRLIFKKHLLAIALLLLCGVSAQAADDDLITQQITIKLDKAGTLPDRIGSSKKYKITNLKIIGEINGTDLRLIRDMAGHDVEGDSTAGKLTSLDLADAQIVSGGGKYYNPDFSTNCYCYTAKDKLGDCTFYKCSKLKYLIIPSSVTSIGDYAFSGCSKLTSIYISAEIPASTTNSTFEGVDKDKCILYVPQGTYQDYWLAEGWGDFKNIVEYDATKVDNSVVDKEIKEVARYTANGQRLDTPTKGLNIVRYSDGSVRKELHN